MHAQHIPNAAAGASAARHQPHGPPHVASHVVWPGATAAPIPTQPGPAASPVIGLAHEPPPVTWPSMGQAPAPDQPRQAAVAAAWGMPLGAGREQPAVAESVAAPTANSDGRTAAVAGHHGAETGLGISKPRSLSAAALEKAARESGRPVDHTGDYTRIAMSFAAAPPPPSLRLATANAEAARGVTYSCSRLLFSFV